jgi:hypothetical protein
MTPAFQATTVNVAAGVVRRNVWLDTSQIATGGCDSQADLLHLASVRCRATEAPLACYGGPR